MVTPALHHATNLLTNHPVLLMVSAPYKHMLHIVQNNAVPSDGVKEANVVFASTRPGGWGPGATSPISAPLRLREVTVPPDWVDYNGHMSEWCYLVVMGDSSDAFFRYVGIDDDYRAAGASLFTVETHIRNLLEASLGDVLALALRVLDVDAKRVHLAHELIRPDGAVAATGEQMLLHVDTSAGKASELPATLHDRLCEIASAHDQLTRPTWVGHVMEIPKGAASWTSR